MPVSKTELQRALARYEEALAIKSKQLPALDRWYRSELTATLQHRQSNENGAFLTSKELVQLMKWKLTRGKFRPRLEQLAQSNSEEFVQSQTRKAFECISKSDSLESAKESLTALNALKGVGPATSSAIIAAFVPKSLPFMSDEALEVAVELSGKPKYNMAEWQWFTEKMKARATLEKWKRGAQELEESAWAYVILKKNGKLDEKDLVPPPSTSSAEVDTTATKNAKRPLSSDDEPKPTSKRNRKQQHIKK